MTYTKYDVSSHSDPIESVVSDETNINFLRLSDPELNNRENQLVDLNEQFLETSISEKKGIHPRTFCRRWFGLEFVNEYGRYYFTEEQILAIESEHGYRERCINLLARILKIKPNTIHRWGKGVTFNKIPDDKRQKYEVYLGYVDTIRIITMSLRELDEDLFLKVLNRLEMK